MLCSNFLVIWGLGAEVFSESDDPGHSTGGLETNRISKMEFEELKIEVPTEDDEQDDENWPSVAVCVKYCVHLCLAFSQFLNSAIHVFIQQRTYENKAGTFVTGFDVNSKVIILKSRNYLKFHCENFVKIQSF